MEEDSGESSLISGFFVLIFEIIGEIWGAITGTWEGFLDALEGWPEFLNDFFYYFLNVAIEGGKAKKGWKGGIFLWPIGIAIILVVYWIIKIVV